MEVTSESSLQPHPEEFSCLQSPHSFDASLQHGQYLQILESYGVNWDIEKVARDIWQNFYDAEGSLDKTTVQQFRVLGSGHSIKISGPSTYSYKKLLHIGGTSKAGAEDTVGGFGEGAKIAALVLLRDFKATKVLFSSADWQLEFYLDDVGELYDEEARGLFTKFSQVTYQSGNTLEIQTPKKETTKALQAGREFFYYSGHPHFENPSFQVNLPEWGIFGFKLLSEESERQRDCGFLYDCGQARHYEYNHRWNMVGGMHLWTLEKKAFDSDRDRGVVRERELESKVITPVISKLSHKQAKAMLVSLTPLWSI